MKIQTINGQALKTMLLGGAAVLSENSSIVNELNVFPVPDGDTGYNMLKTLEGGLKNLKLVDSDDVGEVISSFASGTLLGARGNSGVILSQIFKGISNGLKNVKEADALQLKLAFEEGVKCAYKAVERPVEGTILTVYREATEALSSVNELTSIDELLRIHVENAQKTLVKTKEMLPVLREADVVDSGGAGYLYIAEGFIKALTGEEIAVTLDDFSEEQTEELDFSLFTKDSVMKYGYCTEFILRLQSSKVDVDNFDTAVIVDYLKSIGGDSIVACKTDDAVKVHVHTFTPGLVLQEAQKYGEFLSLKIENMTLQHSETKKKAPKKRVAVAAVASGEGLEELFKDLGADGIVNGGQTSNPSAGDFIKVFDELNAENILVLPNNSNVLLAAKQAADMYKNSNVIVINTKTIQEGYVALSLINTSVEDLQEHVEEIHDELSSVVGIDVTYAVRNATIGGKTVIKGDYMGISKKELLASAPEKVATAVKSLQNVANIEDKELITVFFGSDVTEEEKTDLETEIAKNFPDQEFIPYEGGQEVYSFLIVIE